MPNIHMHRVKFVDVDEIGLKTASDPNSFCIASYRLASPISAQLTNLGKRMAERQWAG